MSDQSLAVKYFEQSAGLCGPASLKMLLSYFGKTYTEAQLAMLSQATIEHGTEHEGLVRAAQKIGGYVYGKEQGTIEDLSYFLQKEKLPVIIGWFDKDGDHYSVVVNVTEKNVIIVDPATGEPERWLDRESFPRVWFDFVGADNRAVSWGWFMVVTFEKKKFSLSGGRYY